LYGSIVFVPEKQGIIFGFLLFLQPEIYENNFLMKKVPKNRQKALIFS